MEIYRNNTKRRTLKSFVRKPHTATNKQPFHPSTLPVRSKHFFFACTKIFSLFELKEKISILFLKILHYLYKLSIWIVCVCLSLCCSVTLFIWISDLFFQCERTRNLWSWNRTPLHIFFYWTLHILQYFFIAEKTRSTPPYCCDLSWIPLSKQSFTTLTDMYCHFSFSMFWYSILYFRYSFYHNSGIALNFKEQHLLKILKWISSRLLGQVLT